MKILPNIERLSAFKKNVLVQVLAFANILLVKNVLELLKIPNASTITEVIFLVITSWYLVSLYQMVGGFTNNKTVMNTVLGSFSIALLFGSVASNPFVEFFDNPSDKIPYLALVHICFSVGTFIIIYHTILEIFDEGITFSERLWGATCVYFMIAWAFGGIFDLISVVSGNGLGFAHPNTISSYLECIAYSISVLGNFNPIYQNIHPLIARLAIIEAVWAHLFVVIVVGRLLSK